MRNKNIKGVAVAILLGCCSLARADTANCWDMAAQRYGVDAWLLLAIAGVESDFTSGIEVRNKNGTYDLGIMQVNTIHVPTYEALGVSRNDLKNNVCKNIYAAARKLKISLNKYGNNIDGIGGYHSYTPKLRRAYGKKVLNKYQEIVQRFYIRKEPFRITYK